MTVVWSGSLKTPLTDSDGWQQKYAADVVSERAEKLLQQAAYRSITARRRCGCGNLARKGKTRCWTCQQKRIYHGAVVNGRPKHADA